MEAEEKEMTMESLEELTVDFSKQSIRKIERANNNQQQAISLILDDNEIQRLDNLDSYMCLKQLSLVNNQLIRMYGVSCLIHLEILDISNNSLVTIEGLKDLKKLKHLNLAKNKIKTIEHLNTNLNLEKLNLSENSIIHISDISFLKNLRELNLHGNRISQLRPCEKHLPNNLEILTLNNNSIYDLNEVSYLAHLKSLRELSFESNPCVNFAENQKKFNYRPFIKNWCSNLLVLDNCYLDDIECLKAEWLYSQGRGRSFRPGEQAALAEYLSGVCPKKAEESDELDDMKKLKLILSKAQQHQQQLREQLSIGKTGSSESIKHQSSKKKSSVVFERMATSFQDALSKDYQYSPDLMTRSLDSGMLRNSPPLKSKQDQIPLQATSTFIPIPDTLISPDVCQSVQPYIPIPQRPSSISSRTSRSSSRNSPHSTPENKRKVLTNVLESQIENSNSLSMKKSIKVNSRSSTPLRSISRNTSSPGSRGSNVRGKNYRETSEEEDSEISALKYLSVHQKSNKKKENKKNCGTGKEDIDENVKHNEILHLEKESMDHKIWKAVVCIQRWWRGYRARNLNDEVLTACKNLQMSRMQDYITKVVNDMEATRIALEGNRKLQVLQMQAINALWKKMTALQPNNAVEDIKENKTSLQNLVETCTNLNKQVEGLQTMMKALQGSSNPSSLIPIGTQTEIVAIHTPQGEEGKLFPYNLSVKSCSQFRNQTPNDNSTCEFKEGVSSSLPDISKNLQSDSVTNISKPISKIHSKHIDKDTPNEEYNILRSHELSDSISKPSTQLSDTDSFSERLERLEKLEKLEGASDK